MPKASSSYFSICVYLCSSVGQYFFGVLLSWRFPMELVTGHIGWIEVICGPMFSGKSEELIRRLRRALIARKRVQVFKPVIDDRYSVEEIVSHSALRLPSEAVQNGKEILEKLDWRTQVIGIDESNFFGDDLIDI